ncbi:hypothetical protein H9P43_002326 [Blastocladiella emersonii ATCC 22665]|nr:hypothetical protein H9P43_002326 [Blastocladiella emersonii ATCC 22665]
MPAQDLRDLTRQSSSASDIYPASLPSEDSGETMDVDMSGYAARYRALYLADLAEHTVVASDPMLTEVGVAWPPSSTADYSGSEEAAVDDETFFDLPPNQLDEGNEDGSSADQQQPSADEPHPSTMAALSDLIDDIMDREFPLHRVVRSASPRSTEHMGDRRRGSRDSNSGSDLGDPLSWDALEGTGTRDSPHFLNDSNDPYAENRSWFSNVAMRELGAMGASNTSLGSAPTDAVMSLDPAQHYHARDDGGSEDDAQSEATSIPRDEWAAYTAWSAASSSSSAPADHFPARPHVRNAAMREHSFASTSDDLWAYLDQSAAANTDRDTDNDENTPPPAASRARPVTPTFGRSGNRDDDAESTASDTMDVVTEDREGSDHRDPRLEDFFMSSRDWAISQQQSSSSAASASNSGTGLSNLVHDLRDMRLRGNRAGSRVADRWTLSHECSWNDGLGSPSPSSSGFARPPTRPAPMMRPRLAAARGAGAAWPWSGTLAGRWSTSSSASSSMSALSAGGAVPATSDCGSGSAKQWPVVSQRRVMGGVQISAASYV